MEFLELAKSRYSVRKFDPRPVEEEKLQKILESGRVAPTAKNMQPQKIYVLESPEAIAAIQRCVIITDEQVPPCKLIHAFVTADAVERC